MATQATRGPLDPGPDDRETALAARWRRLREGVPPAVYLLACAAVLALALVGVGWVLAKVVHDDGPGRADAGVSRWFAGERTTDLNDATVLTSEVGGTLSVTILAALAGADGGRGGGGRRGAHLPAGDHAGGP
jgi:hypothetical protein